MLYCSQCGGSAYEQNGQRFNCRQCGALARGTVEPSQLTHANGKEIKPAKQQPAGLQKNILIGTAIFIVLSAASIMGSQHSEQPAQSVQVSSDVPQRADTTDAPQPAPDQHALRVAARTWYLQIVNDLAIAHAAGAVSADSVRSGDMTAASLILKRAVEAADRAVSTSTNGPDGVDWGAVPQEFNEASVGLRDSLNGMRKALDDGQPSSIADADDSLSASTRAYGEAVHDARIKFEAMGGKWSDLPDGQTEENDAAALLRAMAASGN